MELFSSIQLNWAQLLLTFAIEGLALTAVPTVHVLLMVLGLLLVLNVSLFQQLHQMIVEDSLVWILHVCVHTQNFI